ncbi:gliding motility-associated ABC transporter ATP-binding subunit GldA [Algoriphagus sp. C2-6-M1]|uniref:gliding motility-associated ABC transporter ATP-binding subunit GldA n=1 Tax=Algoriphagus persicinus TaxID=3108754 RepID=UPI002B371025|nr:gliding motility-associated ABC transporter ATP-binding subunit GldA [Algoriphagus sp. C2-6-M1]MEB2781873.1 gliding motility-associated ABC transporter ATP-binding subunit GldA [Algoriphagus sp. C2-6-M1]
MSLEVSKLTKLYGNQKALDDVSFFTTPGRILGFLGPNGAGKSTMMKIITGFLSADSGDVKVMGKDPIHFPTEVSRLIGYLPEHNPLYLDMFVREFLEFSGGLYGLSGQILKLRTREMLNRTGLEPEQHKKIGQLSKGYRQRVGLARALIHDPQVIILDEPTTGLDPNQLVDIRSLIQEVAKDKTLILSTHIMQEVEAICHDVVIINKGKILASDSLSNLKSNANETILILETEEDLELEWFVNVGQVDFGAKGQIELLISAADPAIARKAIIQILHERSLNLVSLNQSKKTLELIFREITNA